MIWLIFLVPILFGLIMLLLIIGAFYFFPVQSTIVLLSIVGLTVLAVSPKARKKLKKLL